MLVFIDALQDLTVRRVEYHTGKSPVWGGARIVRYADDIVIQCRNSTEQPMARLQHGTFSTLC